MDHKELEVWKESIGNTVDYYERAAIFNRYKFYYGKDKICKKNVNWFNKLFEK